MSTIGFNQLILFNAGWWVFATAAAFGAAVLFWNKGAAQLSGTAPGTNLAVKTSGAGAIWGITLLLFFLIHPLREFTDANHIVLITTQQESEHGPASNLVANDPDFVQQLKAAHDQLGDGELGVELIYSNSDFLLEHRAGNTYGYREPIPAGHYELRVTNLRTHTRWSGSFDLEAPASLPAPVAALTPAAVPAVPSSPAAAPKAGGR